MRQGRIVFGLVALVPAVFNAVPALAREGGMLVPLCTGDGQVRMIELPGGGNTPASDPAACCVKGCHTGSSRKRLARNFEPAQ